jgi:hypothetical protein
MLEIDAGKENFGIERRRWRMPRRGRLRTIRRRMHAFYLLLTRKGH